MSVKNKLSPYVPEKIKEYYRKYVFEIHKEFWREIVLFTIKRLIRERLPNNSKKQIRTYKGIAQNKRCFLIGTGPSLRIQDLELLTKEDCFSANSILLSFPSTRWRPKYYFILDKYAYRNFRIEIEKYQGEIDSFFYSDEFSSFPCVGNKMLIDYSQHYKRRHNIKPIYTISNDPSIFVSDGNTVMYAMIQFAIYMGYKEIYLLGADCNYTAGNRIHFIENEKTKKVNCPPESGMLMIEAYKALNGMIEGTGIDIYNATRGGMLEVFPRVELESVLKERGMEKDNEQVI